MEASKTLRAPAKVNLTLEVLQRRSDGLHSLRSVMVPLDLYDELLIEPAAQFSFSCDAEPLQSDNLVERAARALPVLPKVKIVLKKRIPTGAGMGGGSSDAAAIVLAAAQGALGAIEGIDSLQLARSLGSDVPFFLTQTAALVEGTGERVTALGVPPRWHTVIVKPPASVSTAWAYQEIDKTPRATRPRRTSVSLRMGEALQRGDYDAALELMQNDFHDVIVPADRTIAQAVHAMQAAGAARPMLTGSGSCVFALVRDKAQREAIRSRIDVPAQFQTFACALAQPATWRSAA